MAEIAPKPDASQKRTNIQLSPGVQAQVAARAQPYGQGFALSGTINESLDRYFMLLSRARAMIRDRFTEGELSLMCDSMNGVITQAWSVVMLSVGIEDSIELDGLDRKWGVDGPALIAKLDALTVTERCALVDAVERFWLGVTQGTAGQPGDILQEPRERQSERNGYDG